MSVSLRFQGEVGARLWGLDAEERARRIADQYTKQHGALDGRVLIVDRRFAFDPQWFRYIAQRPGTALTFQGETVLANVSVGGGEPLETRAHEEGLQLYNPQLRKREQPFLNRLTPATVPMLERASYNASYKGVTDLLTKYLWPGLAFHLTRLAASVGMTPNMVTAIGAALCTATFFLWTEGAYWSGMAAALGFMVLDTVDGKLARCTITSSWWGNVFDHGIDLVHPPFWWWAWGTGLGAAGLALEPAMFWALMIALVAGYILQRVIEGVFIKRAGMHIHVWEPVDTRFRLITARRNPNMVILFASLLAGRPDLGLWAITAWTLLSLGFHFVRLLQAEAVLRQGRGLTSWLERESVAS